MKLIIFTDGGARRNPGPAGVGVVIYDEQKYIIEKIKKFLGTKTNNQAEYEAVVAGMERALALKAEEIDFFLDSELVVKQLRGEYKIKNPGIAPLAARVLTTANRFKRVSFTHIPREKNQLADQLVNEAIDEATAG